MSGDPAAVQRIAAISFHTCPLEPPGQGDAGGLNVFVLQLGQALARLGKRVDIFTRCTSEEAPRAVIAGPGVRVVHLEAGPPSPLPKSELAAYMDDFCEAMLAHTERCGFRYDAVHSHYWMSGVAGDALASVNEAPHVHTAHTLERAKRIAGVRADGAIAGLRERFEAEVLAFADVVTAATAHEEELLRTHYAVPPEKIRILTPGYDPFIFTPEGELGPSDWLETRAEISALVQSDFPLVVAAGRIQPLKAFDVAVEAVELVRRLDPRLRNVGLLICGGPSGPEGEKELHRLRSLAKASTRPEKTVVTGPVGRRELAALMRRADVVLVTSLTESFGMVALEAQASGTPVVSRAVGGAGEVVEHGVTGFLVDSPDPEAFARAVAAILVDEDLKSSMSREACRRVKGRTWDETARTALEVYSVRAASTESRCGESGK